jgi:hypothetical protein
MADPKTDDFRLEQRDDKLVVTFTPTGARYRFLTNSAQPSEPREEEPPRTDAPDYAEGDVRRMAVQLAGLALSKPPN